MDIGRQDFEPGLIVRAAGDTAISPSASVSWKVIVVPAEMFDDQENSSPERSGYSWSGVAIPEETMARENGGDPPDQESVRGMH